MADTMNSSPRAIDFVFAGGHARFELLVGIRRETGSHLKLIGILSVCLLIPAMLLLLALATQNAAVNLEQRRYISAFIDSQQHKESIDALVLTLTQDRGIRAVTVLPAVKQAPTVLEIQPNSRLTITEVESLAQQLGGYENFSFIALNEKVIERNITATHQANKLAKGLFVLALLAASVICIIVVRTELFRSNMANINMQRQLGATDATISRPFIYRAALLTTLSVAATATFVTLFNKIIEHFVDITSYSSVLLHSLPITHLLLLATVCIAAGSFAAATALQSIFSLLIQMFRKMLPNLT